MRDVIVVPSSSCPRYLGHNLVQKPFGPDLFLQLREYRNNRARSCSLFRLFRRVCVSRPDPERVRQRKLPLAHTECALREMFVAGTSNPLAQRRLR